MLGTASVDERFSAEKQIVPAESPAFGRGADAIPLTRKPSAFARALIGDVPVVASGPCQRPSERSRVRPAFWRGLRILREDSGAIVPRADRAAEPAATLA
jgi:hypothetical protein